jgi:hypothetical protein
MTTKREDNESKFSKQLADLILEYRKKEMTFWDIVACLEHEKFHIMFFCRENMNDRK